MNKFFCPNCKIDNPENAKYCCMCGKSLSDLQQEQIKLEAIKQGKIPLLEKQFETETGIKKLCVVCGDIMLYPGKIDLLTVSSLPRKYSPLPGTLIGSLFDDKGIIVEDLAVNPFLDLRDSGNCWISKAIQDRTIHRIGCVELLDYKFLLRNKGNFLPIIKTYFHLLDIAGDLGINIRHTASPMLGTGGQKIDEKLISIPLINEVISFLRRNPFVECYTFFHRTYEKACSLATLIENSYQIHQMEHPMSNVREKPYVFISYTTQGDQDAADLICRTLKEKNIEFFYAPRDIHGGAYAESIFNAINKCTHFICLISENSMRSEHVLNEIDLAFQHLKDGLKILPYRLDRNDNQIKPSFSYYLSRMQWSYGCPPPEEERAREFIEKIFGLKESSS